MTSKVEHLVVDTSAFIKNTPLQDFGTNIITLDDVVSEIKNKRQLRNLVVLPYDLKIKDVFPENVAFVTEFSKKTGDYRSLSSTDIKVIALTYQLEKQYVGTEHLKTEPVCPKAVEYMDHSLSKPTDVAGFYLPKKGEETDSEEEEDVDYEIDEEEFEDALADDEEFVDALDEDPSQEIDDDLTKAVENLNFDDVDCDKILKKVDEDQDESGISDEEVSEDDDDEDHGWITPSNLALAKKKVAGEELEEKPVSVACCTTDFAMQNVLKQIGLTVVSLEGKVISQLRTYIFRCYACYKTTSVMTKVFCPKCGNKTLKRVAVTVDKDGKQVLHINLRRPLTARGKKFTLPAPKGGKHALNPILCEDQRVPDQQISRLAKTKNNPLDPDYIAGYSPFVMRDVSSKSIVLGLHRKGEFKNWMRRNPNEVMKRRRKK